MQLFLVFALFYYRGKKYKLKISSNECNRKIVSIFTTKLKEKMLLISCGDWSALMSFIGISVSR